MKTMVVMPTLSFSQVSYSVINYINDLVARTINEVSVCQINPSPKVQHTNFAIMNPSEIDSFYNGVLVSTTIDCAREILGAATNSKKVLYLYDIEWLNKAPDYQYIVETLADSRLKVFTRSKSHQKLVENMCGVRSKVIKNFNLEEIWNSLE